MKRHFETELTALADKILLMGGYVEKAIEESTQALIDRRSELFQEVFKQEREINSLHIEVDEDCLRLLARQSPLAADLRLILAIIKINTDLERMGDQAINISYNGQHYLQGAPLKPLIDLPMMAKLVRQMVRNALDAFVRRDPDLAHVVLSTDDQVDALKNKIFKDLQDFMKRDPDSVERALNLILIARNMERIGDHATNIAEDVIFVISGRDVRHGKRSAAVGGQ